MHGFVIFVTNNITTWTSYSKKNVYRSKCTIIYKKIILYSSLKVFHTCNSHPLRKLSKSEVSRFANYLIK